MMYHSVHILLLREAIARGRDEVLLVIFGMVFWTAGTLWFERTGPRVFETTAARYWINFMITPIVSAAGCFLILFWRKIPAAQWAPATLLIAIPGMVGEAVLLSHFSALMPKMHEASAGKYGAFLFSTYALVLTISEIVTLRAAR